MPNSNKIHCRCRKCETRRALRMHPDKYYVIPKCKVCGARDYRIDKWMNKRKSRKQICFCDGYWFPHREKSKWCIHNPNYPVEEIRYA